MSTSRTSSSLIMFSFVLGVILSGLLVGFFLSTSFREQMTVTDKIYAGDGMIDYPIIILVPHNAQLQVTLELFPVRNYNWNLMNMYKIFCGDTNATIIVGDSIDPFGEIFNPDWGSYGQCEVIVNCSDFLLSLYYHPDYGIEIPEISHDASAPIRITVTVIKFWRVPS